MKSNQIICLAPREIFLTEGQKEVKETTNDMDERTGELYQTIQIAQTYADTITRMKLFSHPKLPELKPTQDKLSQQVEFWQTNLKPSLGVCITELRGFYDAYVSRYDLMQEQTDDIDKDSILKYLGKLEKKGTATLEKISRSKSNIKDFNDQIADNKTRLSDIVKKITSFLKENKTKLASHKKELDEIEAKIKELEKKLIASSVFTGLGALAIIVGVVLIATGVGAAAGAPLLVGGIATTAIAGGFTGKINKELTQKKKARTEKLEAIKVVNEDSALLSNIESNFSGLITQGDEVIIAFNNLHTGLASIYNLLLRVLAKAKNLSATVKDDDSDLTDVQIDLKLLHSEFTTLKENAAKYEKNFVLPIQEQTHSAQSSLLIPDLSMPFIPGHIAYASQGLAICEPERITI
jgi:hypothetical protein